MRVDDGFSCLAPGLTQGEYWVLYIAPDCRVALLAHPKREYLWRLSRNLTFSPIPRDACQGGL